MNNQNQTDATEDRDFRDALLSSIGTTGDGCENAISGRPLLNISHDFQSDLVAETAREMIRGAESFGILGEGSPDLISPEARIRYGAEAVSETVSALKSVIATLQHAVKKSAYAIGGRATEPDREDLSGWTRAAIEFCVATLDFTGYLRATIVDYYRNGNPTVNVYPKGNSENGSDDQSATTMIDLLSQLSPEFWGDPKGERTEGVHK